MRTPEGGKFISVVKMKELLATLPDDTLLCAQTIGRTGNIGLYEKDVVGELVMVAAIDVWREAIEWYDAEAVDDS